jgi:hypothetical protein
MNRLIGVLITVIAAAFLPACDFGLSGLDWSTESLTVVLSGTVTTPDGSPVSGATVQLALGNSIGLFGFGVYGDSAVTDSAGRYTGRVFCSGDRRACPDLEVVAHLDRFERGLAPQVQTLYAIQSRDSVVAATLDFSLRPTRPITVVVHGLVTSGPDEVPVPNATVILAETFWPFRSDSTTTDVLGAYEMASEGHCALSGSICMHGSLQVQARQGSQGQQLDFAPVPVEGDSLDVEANLVLQ